MELARTRSFSLQSDYTTALRRHPGLMAFAGAASLLGAIAIVNGRVAKKAEHDNPPRGQFLEIDGIRLHYVERGTGRPLGSCTATAA